jgi:cysteine synthase
LFVKIEAFNPLGSVKDRLARGVIEDAERTGKPKPGQTVIEAMSGNTGFGLAIVCAQKGYPLVVTMAETFSVERLKLMRFLRAKVVITPAAERRMGIVKIAVECRDAWLVFDAAVRERGQRRYAFAHQSERDPCGFRRRTA